MIKLNWARAAALPAAVVAVACVSAPALAAGNAAEPAESAHAARSAGTPVAAQAACVLRFRVSTTEDLGAGGDEPYLKVNTVFWRAPGSMDDGAVAAVNKTVHVGDVVQAWDDDSPDGDDFIGSDTVTSSGTLLNFTGDGAVYSARYRLGAC
ncbi:hypothetical protein E1293_13575 [Actinomadura darangshiensis]|uniref:Uncharacterized protein n=1 Tax=Actinomadura darangshiensis TaxID=705336 RepID=A0A4R5BC47_9ACTN|nr:hypothetical protein [Actinomadura darangshiensis]TDD84048.1 hypothetical protein E1293_13575 [Actinomadura darangshiensis]